MVIPAFIICRKSETQLFENNPALYILAFGFVAAKVTNRLVVRVHNSHNLAHFRIISIGCAYDQKRVGLFGYGARRSGNVVPQPIFQLFFQRILRLMGVPCKSIEMEVFARWRNKMWFYLDLGDAGFTAVLVWGLPGNLRPFANTTVPNFLFNAVCAENAVKIEHCSPHEWSTR